MNQICVRGFGVVSPAGWGIAPFLKTLQSGKWLPTQTLQGPAAKLFYPVRTVSAPVTQPGWMAHPRLRRASAISHFALGAALEALQPCASCKPDATRFGIVTGTHASSLRYVGRFYGEVLSDPSTASPMLFPETVINATASHLATFLGGAKLTYSLTGDQTVFIQALVVAAQWLLERRVDMCLVVGAEEVAWPAADVMQSFGRGIVASEGAAAIVLAREVGSNSGILLERITDAHLYAGQVTKQAAAKAMREDFPRESQKELLVDARCGVRRVDWAETSAWRDWSGPRLSPRVLLGEGMSAATAWQCVAACAALTGGQAVASNVSAVGGNQQSIGARFQIIP